MYILIFIYIPRIQKLLQPLDSFHSIHLPISRPIRSTFSQKKCDLNLTCVLCAEGKYYFQTCKYPYPHQVKTTMKMILVAVTTIFWVSVMSKLYYGC